MKPERRFRVNQVIPFLKTLKRTAFFPIQQKAIRGDADFMMVVNGRFVWLELKSRTGKPDKVQKFKRKQVLAANGVALVSSPTNWKRVKKYLTLLTEI